MNLIRIIVNCIKHQFLTFESEKETSDRLHINSRSHIESKQNDYYSNKNRFYDEEKCNDSMCCGCYCGCCWCRCCGRPNFSNENQDN